jgi:Cu/Ag efflux protein CusF
MMNRRKGTLALIAAGLLFLAIPVMQAQPKGKKEYTFKGKVERIDTSAKKLVVANEKIDGWMEAMTMGYAVDKADDVIKRVKPGDQITAKVYDGDYTLYDVQVAPASSQKK